MNDKLKMISNAPFTLVALFFVILCMCVNAVAQKILSDDSLAMASIVIGGASFFALIIWAVYIWRSGKIVNPVSLKYGMALQIVSYILLCVWIWIMNSPISVCIWAPVFIWFVVRSYNDLKSAE